MKNTAFISLCFFSSLFFQTFAMQQQPSQKKIDVVLDLALLIEPNKTAGFAKLSKWDLLKMGTESVNLETHFLKLLHELYPPQTGFQTAIRDNQPAPQCIVDFLLGQKSSETIIAEVKKAINDKKPEPNYKSLMLQLVEITFDPKKSAEVMQANSDAQKLVKTLIQKYRVHVLGNWNNLAFDQLKVQHKALFNLINGSMIVSGHAHATKSSNALYVHFFKTAQCNLEDCLFVESESIHADTGQKYGLQCQPPKKIITCLYQPSKTNTQEKFFNSIPVSLQALATQPAQSSSSSVASLSANSSLSAESNSSTISSSSVSSSASSISAPALPSSSSSESTPTVTPEPQQNQNDNHMADDIMAIIAAALRESTETYTPLSRRCAVNQEAEQKIEKETKQKDQAALIAHITAARQLSLLPDRPSTTVTFRDMNFELMPGNDVDQF